MIMVLSILLIIFACVCFLKAVVIVLETKGLDNVEHRKHNLQGIVMGFGVGSCLLTSGICLLVLV